ncbi:MAG: hypothetical protein GX568_01735 [Candidatus Gastranaerophilales bacterium]|jgi:hypothetical protein|nr:hypothetical protein [Candidatus Gastranaerophilales bacterium]
MVKPATQKNIQRKGTALMDYVLTAVVFAMVVGVSIAQLKPELLMNYFKYAMGFSEKNGSQIQLKVLGE